MITTHKYIPFEKRQKEKNRGKNMRSGFLQKHEQEKKYREERKR
jgi:hypothetical protein